MPDDPFLRAQRVVLQSFNVQDPPAHTRIRKLVQQAFTRAAVDEQRVRGLVEALLAVGAARRDGELELVTELAFPITIASEMIGIPTEARDRFRASFEDTERLGDPIATAAQRGPGRAALVWQLAFIGDVADARRPSPRLSRPGQRAGAGE